MKQEKDNPRLKEWKRKLAEGKKTVEKKALEIGIGTPKSHKGGDWDRVGRIIGLIVLFNLIAFCTVMLVVDISLFTKPTVVPQARRRTVFDRAQKDD